VVENAANQVSSDADEDASVDMNVTPKQVIPSVPTIAQVQSLVSEILPEIAEDRPSVHDSIGALTDTIPNACDTTKVVPAHPFVVHELVADEGFTPISHFLADAWKIRVATNVLGLSLDMDSGDADSGPMSDPIIGNGNHVETETTTSVHHLTPITIGVRISKEIAPSWSVESGLQYNLLRAEITHTVGLWSYVQNVRAGYLSIPVAVNYNFMRMNRAGMYVSGGLSLDIPVSASINSDVTSEHKRLNYPLSVSPGIGLGFEYRMTSSSMLFVQPTLNYHMMKKSEYPLLWQDKPVTFELPVGIRFSW
jgi:hypothetical protein